MAMPPVHAVRRLTCMTAALMSVSSLAMAAPRAAASEAGTLQAESFGQIAENAAIGNEISQGAYDFVQSTAERGLKFLSNPNSSLGEKKQEFRKLLDSSFDLDTIGRFALGTYWNRATPTQQKAYLAQFHKMVVNVYAARFSDYKGQKFEAKSFRPISSTDTLVTSFIVPVDGGSDIQVDWRVRHKGGSYKIVDVLVAGVSMSVTQRSDFASVIQRGGGNVDILIDHLKKGNS